MAKTKRRRILTEVIDYQKDVIRDLDDAELTMLVLQGFPAYGEMNDDKLQAEYEDIFGESENRPVKKNTRK